MVKKIHRLLAEACVHTLDAVFRGGAVPDRAVAKLLGAHPKWGARDRSFVAETIYEIVRWQRRFAWMAQSEDLWILAGWYWALRGYSRPEWAPWPEVTGPVIEGRRNSLVDAPRAIRESLSDELDAFAFNALGSRWEDEITALNSPAPVFIRVNPLRSSPKAVRLELSQQGIGVHDVEGAENALQIEQGKTIPARLKASGRFEIQDAGSQQIAPFLQPGPGHRIVDACAGAGGKTLHLGALTGGRGELIALDVEELKLRTLRARASRAGVEVQTSLVTEEVLTKLRDSSDRVLVDAPCTGSGTLRRQPHLKYRITAGAANEKRDLQRDLLRKFATLVRPGGKLVYATCSILPCENEEQAAWFTAQHKEFTFEEERRISPAATGWDGFYMARWRRMEDRG